MAISPSCQGRKWIQRNGRLDPVGAARRSGANMFCFSSRGKVGSKWERVGQENREVASIHIPDVYIDGSYAAETSGEGFAGHGVWFGSTNPHNISAPLSGLIQTNNRADLTACIEALRAVPLAQPLRVITDSKYVHDGVTTHMLRWALHGCRVVTQDLWGELKLLIQSRSGATLWLHVYSHVGVVGNERAYVLANQGRYKRLWHNIALP